MLKKPLILSLFFLKILSATVIDINIEEKTQKPLQLSASQINRIAVNDDSTATIIGSPHYFHITIDDRLGQAFITLKRPIETPEGITVITSAGFIQDFLVTSQEGEPTIVYLHPPPDPIEIPQSSLATIDTLSDIFEGKVPQGFGRRDFYPNETLDVGPFLSSIQSVTIYEGALENLYVAHIKNLSKAPLSFHKNYFEAQDVNWIFCPLKELKKNQDTLIVVSKRRE